MMLPTALYSPANTTFRLRTDDLNNLVTWQKGLNTRLPAGSKYFMEMGHNGNGDLISAVSNQNLTTCKPATSIQFEQDTATPLEYQKPLGSGTDIWPTTPATYTWSLACAKIDPLAAWYMTAANRDAFAHVSHTFAHMSLNNATHSDAGKEISFNIDWMKQVGISAASKFSGKGLIPPAITGLHNGDVIQAWMENGITAVVGDNTRSVLKNQVCKYRVLASSRHLTYIYQENEFWALTSTVAANGYAGLIIIPRWGKSTPDTHRVTRLTLAATTIFYNCDLPDCTTSEWVNTSGGKGDFTALLANALSVNTRHLLGLHHDPYVACHIVLT
jgi:hypothetical protein